MGKVWKFLLLLLAITILVWLTTMWRWQSAGVDPSGGDVVLNLVVLPLVLTGVLALFVWQVPRLRAYAAAPIAVAAPAGAAEAGAASPAQAPEQAATFSVLDAQVLLGAGTDWAGAHTAITSGDCKPKLDPECKDDAGQDVFTARLSDLNTAPVSDTITSLLDALKVKDPARWGGYECPPQMVRALTAMQTLWASLQESIESRLKALGQIPPAPTSGTRVPGSPPPAPMPRWVIQVGLPAQWSALSQQLASAWVTEQMDELVQRGLTAAGQSPAMASTPQAAVQLQVHMVASADALWMLLDQQLVQWHRESAPGLLLALAADCLIAKEVVSDWSRAGDLFSGSAPRGRVPGEGAAALLLASAQWKDAPDAAPALAKLHRASMMRREKSADASGRVTADTLRETAAAALRGSGVDAAKVKHLTTDLDHRASRKGEVFGTLQEDLPHIEPLEETLALAEGCGDLGVARLLACVALAVDKVKTSDNPVLVLGTYPPVDRFAVAVVPPTSARGEDAPPSAQGAA